MRWLITETTEYLLNADTLEEAREKWEDYGPEVDEAEITYSATIETKIEPADA